MQLLISTFSLLSVCYTLTYAVSLKLLRQCMFEIVC